MRIGGEAPGRRLHSSGRRKGHVRVRRAAASDRLRKPATDRPAQASDIQVFPFSCSGGAQGDALRNFTGPYHSPKCDEQLTCESDDHSLAYRSASLIGHRSIPLGQSALLLEHEEPPSELYHTSPDAGIASPGETFFPSPLAAFVWRAGETGVASDRSLIPQVARQYLVHEHVCRLNPDADLRAPAITLDARWRRHDRRFRRRGLQAKGKKPDACCGRQHQ